MNLQYVAFMVYLKRLGDQHLESHRYTEAYSIYATALTLEDFWPYFPIPSASVYHELQEIFVSY